VFFCFRNVKPDSSPTLFQDGFTALARLSESLGEIEEFLIRGVVYILDVGGLGIPYLKVLPLDDLLKIAKNAEKCIATRMKGFHVVNVPAGFSYIANIALNTVSPKLRGRIRFHKNFEEFDFVEKKILPKEYGGTIPMKDLCSE
jgi:hypothetical protein